MIKQKAYIEKRLAAAQKWLADRLAALHGAGIGADRIQRDVKVKHFRAAIRQARRQLDDIKNLEESNAGRAAEKAAKQSESVPASSRRRKREANVSNKQAKRQQKEKLTAEEGPLGS